MMKSVALAIFAKTIGKSPVKTRLAADIGTAAAEAFYQLSVAATAEIVKAVKDSSQDSIIPYWALAEQEALNDPQWQAWQDFDSIWTGAGDLGMRLDHIYKNLRKKHDLVVIIGTDSPQLDPTLILDAIARLKQNQASCIIGPALDGGFYLFAAQIEIARTVWTQLRYSQHDTLAQLTRKLAPTPIILLDSKRDVDTIDDLPPLFASLTTNPSPLPAQKILKAWLKFRQCLNSQKCLNQQESESWTGSKIQGWWGHVAQRLTPQYPKINLPEGTIKRADLKTLCKNKASDLECAVSIMAWGGQRRNNGIILFNRFNKIEPIINKMRIGEINPFDAYQQFYRIWDETEPLGMGAAYFTKLIFFCHPSHKGYIMDQWTAKSVNLLAGKKVVHLNSAGYVDERNTLGNYEAFCEYIETLASLHKTSGEAIEMALFSKGGRKKGCWRQYVIDNYKKDQLPRKS